MRTNNPVLSRPDAFTSASQQGYPQGFQPDAYYNPQQQGYAPGQPQDSFNRQPTMAPQQVAGRMTIEDVITKTAMLLLIVVAAASLTMLLLPLQLLAPVAIIGSLVALVTVWIVSARRTISVPAVFAYAVVEGVIIGAFSKLFEYMYPGIVMQAVLGTVVAAFVVLGAYKYLGARVRGRLAQIVVVSMIAYVIVSLINLALLLFGVNLGWATIGPEAGPIAWLAAGLGVVLAAASLLMDFDAIEQGIRIGAPESESWRGAFGLTVTLIWLYTNILRILSFFRD
ncbi:MAG: Bax inhibitor-1/YccA family protein [Brooklawnia sp.]|nr:Bax inhibitor-1/YccA family protein [Brooklawnia sp.]